MRRFLLILLILLLAGGALWYFVIRPKQIENGTAGTGGFRSFLSLGNADTPVVDNTADIPEGNVAATPLPESSPLTQLSASAVAGFTSFTTTRKITVPAADPKQKPTIQTVTDHVVRYVSRANGYVYEIRNGGIATQISNIYIPNVYEAYFADSGTAAILRFLRDDARTIATYRVPIPEQNPDGTRTQLAGTYLPDNITSLAVAPDGKSLVRLTTNGDTAIITTSDSKGGGVKELVRSAFHAWKLSWAGKTVYAQTKAAASTDGFLYRIDPVGKRMAHILGGAPGLTASVSPSGTYILSSESGNDSFQTKLLATKTGTVQELNIAVLPEKCVWLAAEDLICAGNNAAIPSTYPDAWYQGTISFADQLYRIYPKAAIVDILADGTAGSYDATELFADETQNMLYFIDKMTGLLWQFQY
jgi:hypothetical protein